MPWLLFNMQLESPVDAPTHMCELDKELKKTNIAIIGSDFLKNTEEDFCLKQNKITDDHFCFMMKKTSSWSVEECFWLRTQLPPPVLLLLPTTKIMALNPCLSQEPSSANNLLYLALRSRILLILKKFYESVEYAEKIRPIILFDRT